MNVKTQLISELKRQLQIEIKSRDLYSKFLKESNEKKYKTIVSRIEKDEEEHIIVVNKLIKLVEGYKEVLKEKKKTPIQKEKEAKSSKISKSIKGTNSVLFLSSVETYIFKIKKIVKENLNGFEKKNSIYVSYNKIPKYTKKVFEEYGINNDKILFVNCVGSSEAGDINVKPEELTKLSIIINNAVEEMKNPLVVIDTISAFSLYNDTNTISKFVASMNNHAREKNYTILWIALKGEAERGLNDKLAGFCDTVINA